MGQFEGREGQRTKGFYYVLLPGGRRQIVDYYVDGASGYVAEVRYVGQATNNYDNDYKEKELFVEEIYPVYKEEIKSVYKVDQVL